MSVELTTPEAEYSRRTTERTRITISLRCSSGNSDTRSECDVGLRQWIPRALDAEHHSAEQLVRRQRATIGIRARLNGESCERHVRRQRQVTARTVHDLTNEAQRSGVHVPNVSQRLVPAVLAQHHQPRADTA
jgi:hypothetical protein